MFKKLFKKKLDVPQISHIEVEAIHLWQVEWTSRHDIYSGSLKKEFEVFTSEEDATAFANALRAAYKLLRHTSGTEVSLTKRL